MTWKCPICGTENPPSESVCLAQCGYMRLPVRLVLTSAATGKRLRLHISTKIGQALLRTIADGEAGYASEPQFEIVKDQERGAWVVRHHAAARNITCCNGVPLGADAAALESGAVISIGRDRLKLTVTLEDV
jgi:hypothetical protein